MFSYLLLTSSELYVRQDVQLRVTLFSYPTFCSHSATTIGTEHDLSRNGNENSKMEGDGTEHIASQQRALLLLRERLERFVNLGDDRNISRVWVRGKVVHDLSH